MGKRRDRGSWGLVGDRESRERGGGGGRRGERRLAEVVVVVVVVIKVADREDF